MKLGSLLQMPLSSLLGASFGKKADVPQFARDPEVFATSHEGVRLASLRRRGDSGRVKIFLLPSRNGNKAKKIG